MSKLARFRGSLSKARHRVTDLAKGEKIGDMGHDIIRLGVHAGLALASKNISQIGPIPVKPDVAGIAAGLGMMTIGKKNKVRKLGKSIALGAANALITRWVNDGGGFTLIQGADGEVHRSDDSSDKSAA